ncbi:MAG TPA: 3-phosphoshikimate 1-carboxyvinyltransferase [Clostridiales bacterium]|nr:3-phosphoshikimate 1-carboxyvinyltransferase [Clostridiales bacterium]
MEINPIKSLKGTITVAPDKSISHRAVMLASIANGKSLVSNFLMGEDCLATIDCFRKLKVPIEVKEKKVYVNGKGKYGLRPPEQLLYTGNSGTTTRLLCGLLAPQRFSTTLDGDASIRKRPMKRIIEPLIKMGAKIYGTNGDYTPIMIEGTELKGIEYNMPVASAQLKSSLILAGLYAQGETTIIEQNISRNHTEIMVNGFGGDIIVDNNKITVNPVDKLFGQEIEIPGDISSAAFFIVAALIIPNSEIRIKNVGLNETRTGIIDVLRAMGAFIAIENYRDSMEPSGDLIVKTSSLHGVEIGGGLIPRLIDELPALTVAAAFAEGKTIIKDAEELKVKESNRIDAMETELKKAGVEIRSTLDGLVIKGGKMVHGAEFESWNDHRIAMSMSVLALAAEGTSKIKNPQCINVSYPNFFDTLHSIIQK